MGLNAIYFFGADVVKSNFVVAILHLSLPTGLCFLFPKKNKLH
jgi:hypothetical protein